MAEPEPLANIFERLAPQPDRATSAPRPSTLTPAPSGTEPSVRPSPPAGPQTAIPRPGGGPQTQVPGSDPMAALWQRLQPVPVGPAAPKPAATGGFVQRGVEAAGGMVKQLWDNLLAGEQGVKTDPRGAKLAPEREQFLLSEQQTVSDPKKYFAARDPQSGKMAAFERSPDTDAGIAERASQLGHVVGPGMVAAPYGITRQIPAVTRAQQATEEFGQAGVRPYSAAVTGGKLPFLGRKLPFSPVQKGLQRTTQDIGQRVGETAATYGTAADSFEAGATAQNAMRRYAADTSQAKTDYAEVDRLMHGAAPSPVVNTLRVLNDLKTRFPSSPELESVFDNPKLRTMVESLTPRRKTVPAQVSPILGPFGQPIVTAPARTVQYGGTLSIPELQYLRSRVGNLIERPVSPAADSIPKADLRRVYLGITQDLQQAASKQGPGAVRALQRATISYGTRMRVMERLEPLLKPDAPESVFAQLNAAATGRGDAGLLWTAQKTMKPEEWNEVGAAILRRAGKPSPAEIKDPLATPDFSVKAFARNWGRLNEPAKNQLFGPNTTGSPRNGLERLAQISQAHITAAAGGRGPHGGGVAVGVVLEHVLQHLMHGLLGPVAIAGVGGAYSLSKLMMSPGFTQWLYRLPDMVANTPSTEAAVGIAGAMLQQAISGGGLPPQQDPPNPVQPTSAAEQPRRPADNAPHVSPAGP